MYGLGVVGGFNSYRCVVWKVDLRGEESVGCVGGCDWGNVGVTVALSW